MRMQHAPPCRYASQEAPMPDMKLAIKDVSILLTSKITVIACLQACSCMSIHPFLQVKQ